MADIGHTRCPIVKREKRTFYAHVLTPFDEGNKSHEESREVEICWIRESETTVRFLHGGEVVETYGTCNDYYGPGTSWGSEIEAMCAEAAARFGVTEESTAIIEALVTIFDSPVRNPRPGTYKRTEYDRLDRNLYEKNEAGERVFPEPVPVASVVVWSTKPIDSEAARAHVMSYFPKESV